MAVPWGWAGVAWWLACMDMMHAWHGTANGRAGHGAVQACHDGKHDCPCLMPPPHAMA